MKRFILSVVVGVMGTALLPAIAGAQSEPPAPAPQQELRVGEGSPPQTLPPPRSDNDAQPPVAAPTVSATGVTEQAGVGGTQAYGRAGVLEVGGSAGFTRASGFTQMTFSPTVGFFFMDNVEISGILNMNYINAGGDRVTYVTALAEPSLHIPFSQTVFGMFGLGTGISYAEGAGTGFALAPRMGMNLLVGRSGVLTPAFFFAYSTTDAIPTANGTLLAVALSYGLNIGYTVMF